MTKQAENSIGLYAGQNPVTIEKLLAFQSSAVVNELKEHFNVSSNTELAFKLSVL